MCCFFGSSVEVLEVLASVVVAAVLVKVVVIVEVQAEAERFNVIFQSQDQLFGSSQSNICSTCCTWSFEVALVVFVYLQ